MNYEYLSVGWNWAPLVQGCSRNDLIAIQQHLCAPGEALRMEAPKKRLEESGQWGKGLKLHYSLENEQLQCTK